MADTIDFEDLRQRAGAISESTETGSVTPVMVGGLIGDVVGAVEFLSSSAADGEITSDEVRTIFNEE